MKILTINGGSSSIRFALFPAKRPLTRALSGKFDRTKPSSFSPSLFLDRLAEKTDFSQIKWVCHRVVFGMQHIKPACVTPELLRELRRLRPYDPEHLPIQIELIEAFSRRYPQLPQMACFDTAFHSTMPRVARLLPIPRRFDRKGVQRFGFHGLSYAYLMGELTRVAGAKDARGRVIMAHLGHGASMAAVRNGKSIETSMGFTPTAGLLMGTRPGDLDPGVAWYLMRSNRLSPQRFNHLINHESGLLGVSETSSDMQDLIKRQAKDIRAREAVDLFCYQAKKWIGALSAPLGGLDTLVFSGGIGENSPEVRSRICKGLEFLGVHLDPPRNKRSEGVISTAGSTATVRVIRTDEEAHMAGLVLNCQKKNACL